MNRIDKKAGLAAVRAKRAVEHKVELMFYRLANGVQINIFNLGKLSAAGEAVLFAGGDDLAAEAAMVEVIAKFREN